MTFGVGAQGGPPGQPVNASFGGNDSASAAVLERGRYELPSDRFVTRQQLTGVDCQAATHYVRAFGWGNVTQAAASNGGVAFGAPGASLGGGYGQSASQSSQQPIYLELAQLGDASQVSCPAGREFVGGTCQARIDALSFRVQLQIRAKSPSACGSFDGACDFSVSLDRGPKQSLPKGQNSGVVDLGVMTGPRLARGIHVGVFDREAMSSDTWLGDAWVQVSEQMLRSGSFQVEGASDKYYWLVIGSPY